MVKNDDSIAYTEFADSLADSGYFTRGFMPENSRCSVRAGSYFFQVGSTHTAGVNANKNLAGTNFGHGHGLEPHIVDAPIDGGKHSCWDGLAGVFQFDLSGNTHEEAK